MIYMQTPSGEVFGTERASSHPDCTRVTYAARQAYACAQLRKMLKPGDTVHTLLRHVSTSGMVRDISVFIVRKDGVRNIDVLVSDATGRKLSAKQGIRAHGCGMDMGFDLVYSLGYCLWPNGTRKPHGRRNGEPDSDGGYALKHSWI